MNDLILGKKTEYIDKYDASLLDAIDRNPARRQIGARFPLIFKGFDIWNYYEFSWLNLRGKPEIRILEFIIDANSVNIVESKSVKLYLNSFHNTRFENEYNVLEYLSRDLSKIVGSLVQVKLNKLESYLGQPLKMFDGYNIDNIDIEITDFELNKDLIRLNNQNEEVEETLHSNLLKSNCLITNQPDWASAQISYRGQKIDHSSILRYLISFRNHNEFAEPCAERIFTDILDICQPRELTIYTRFTRRGGIDINSIRSTNDVNATEIDNSRHIRQ